VATPRAVKAFVWVVGKVSSGPGDFGDFFGIHAIDDVDVKACNGGGKTG